MTPLAAYADHLSVRPGDTIRFHAAGTATAPLAAAVHRVVSADPNPEIGGVQTIDTGADVKAKGALEPHRVPQGSFGMVDGAGRFAALSRFTILVRVWRQANGDTEQSLVSLLDPMAGHGVGLAIDDAGRPFVSLGQGAARWSRLMHPAAQQLGQ